MIASVAFHNFKALREAQVELRPFNLIVGPNGSGKTSLIQALLRLRTLWRLHAAADAPPPRVEPARADRSIMEFRFCPPPERGGEEAAGAHNPHDQEKREGREGQPKRAGRERREGGSVFTARLSCVSQMVCDQIEFLGAGGAPLSAAAALAAKAQTRWIDRIRAYLFDHYAMAEPVPVQPPAGNATAAVLPELASNGANLSAVLAQLQAGEPAPFARLEEELRRVLPEFSGIEFVRPSADTVQLALRLRAGAEAVTAPDGGAGLAGGELAGELVSADNLSQGTLYLMALLYLAFQPQPPSVVCVEEIDRGIHPRLLRPLRDLLYRLSYPAECGESRRPPVQVLATTHSPYLLDLFKDHPEEIIISQKHGTSAHFERLADRADLGALLGEASLGDLWFSGILGGVPEE
ncbi:hypothetical protein AXK11_07860 [Cephaloticoccus primus]|uniref:Uncharacterized protein n=1 Tax=Cephaloticoccus primus TaxID=1548207 RepID=A0A139SJN4_9BACT|nr:hypothetical protein AXK11_07860 [Cephaloticoccus primus]